MIQTHSRHTFEAGAVETASPLDDDDAPPALVGRGAAAGRTAGGPVTVGCTRNIYPTCSDAKDYEDVNAGSACAGETGVEAKRTEVRQHELNLTWIFGALRWAAGGTSVIATDTVSSSKSL